MKLYNTTTVQKIEQRFLEKLIHNYEKSNDESLNRFCEAINKYLLSVSVIIFINFLFYTFLFGFTTISIVDIALTLYFCFILLLKKKEFMLGIYFKHYILFGYIILIFYNIFLCISTNYLFKQEFYFFPILTSLPSHFDLKKDFNYIILIVLITFFASIAPLFYEFSFVTRVLTESPSKNFTLSLSVLNIVFTFAYTFVNIQLVYKKDFLLKQLQKEKKGIEDNFHELEDDYSHLLKKQYHINNLSPDTIGELKKLAENCSPIYFERFCVLFPTFRDTLFAIDPTLTIHEMHFLSLIKLNFDTKKIARTLDLSVRAVESKKYRLKKKLEIQGNGTIYEFILSI